MDVFFEDDVPSCSFFILHPLFPSLMGLDPFLSFLLDTNLSHNKGNLPIVTVAMGKYCGINVEVCEGVPCTDVSYFPDSLGETIKLMERQDTRFFGV